MILSRHRLISKLQHPVVDVTTEGLDREIPFELLLLVELHAAHVVERGLVGCLFILVLVSFRMFLGFAALLCVVVLVEVRFQDNLFPPFALLAVLYEVDGGDALELVELLLYLGWDPKDGAIVHALDFEAVLVALVGDKIHTLIYFSYLL